MIGSPDLLVFTGGEGFREEAIYHQDKSALPNELSVPLEPSSNPWTSVGPQPLLTIPDDPRVLGSFDLNHFSVRIMSVDYQAAFPGTGGVCPGPRINFTEDSRVVLGDSADGAFAYVQHLTLYDLEARGFVRPLCMAYVSSDQRKLMEHFGELSAHFTRASDSLKTGNRRAFAAELQDKLLELEYTRLTLQQGVDDKTVEELEALESSILNYRDLLRQVTAYPNRKLKHPGFLPYDPADNLADNLADPCPLLPPATVRPSSFSSGRQERRLKTLEELSDAYFLSITELPIKLEAETEGRSNPPTPDPKEGDVGGEMTGSVSSGDSIEVLGTERSYRTQHEVMGSDHRETLLGKVDPWFRRVQPEAACGRRARAYACRANSEDSIEVLSTTDSIIPEDLQAITEEDPEDQPMAYDGPLDGEPPRARGEVADQGEDRTGDFTEKVAIPRDERKEPRGNVRHKGKQLSLRVERDPLEAMGCMGVSDRVQGDTGACQSTGRDTVHEDIVTTMLRAEEKAVVSVPSTSPSCLRGESMPMAMDLHVKFAFTLPMTERATVLPCLTTPLQLTDLLTWRLIGLHRTSSTTTLAVLHSLARYSRYLALLDLDQRTLHCPAYSGSLIGQIANCHSSICTGSTYLLHLESCLTALANQALFYTFHPALRGDGHSNDGGGAKVPERQFCGSEDDLRVMRFLSDLIKRYHAGCGPPILSVSYRQMQIHKHMAAT
ncbi:hypothetical protein NHX12_018577 [Muraenolepis orangiensis]|uniref:UDENN FLCN/SMCR8-type domain-containing protein n=1 Tax=Muraenolepis orangiensis TaxID=630683 RepID=A0A9Q0IXQ9_9TELE|nr:hypothetical protein NHX12_018577 [Muraenolepis orangiensis]